MPFPRNTMPKRSRESIYTATFTKGAEDSAVSSSKDYISCREIDADQRRRCWEAVLLDPIIAAALSIEASYLLGQEMAVIVGGERQDQTPQTRYAWFVTYRPCLASTLQSIAAQGVVVVGYRRDKGIKENWVPFIPAWNLYRLYVVITNEGRIMYVAEPQKHVQENENANINFVVYDIFGHAPTPDGKLTSPVASLLDDIMYQQAIKKFILMSSFWRANPPRVYERRPEWFAHQASEETLIAYADTDEMCGIGKTEQRAMENEEAAAFDRMVHSTANAFEGEGALAARLVYRTPDDYHLTTMAPSQEVRTDFVSQRAAHIDIVCSRLNIPRDLLMSKSAHATKAGSTVYHAFRVKIGSLANLLSALLTDMYIFCEGRDLISKAKSTIKVPGFSVKRYDETIARIFLLTNDTEVRVEFDIAAFVSLSDLNDLEQRNVISHATHVTLAAGIVGVPVEEEMKEMQSSMEEKERRQPLEENVESAIESST